MHKRHTAPSFATSWRARTLLVSTCLALSGCAEDAPDAHQSAQVTQAAEQAEEGSSVDLGKLPFVDGLQSTQVFIQQLKEPTKLGENVAVSVRLPPPANEKLKESLVRVLGEPERPV